MKKNDEWFIYIEDQDQNLYALTGPILERFVDEWFAKVVHEQNAGRELSCQDIAREQLAEIKEHARKKGLSETDIHQIINAPIDRSDDYIGKLPKYAEAAVRAKVVHILCKGKCATGRWAEMNKPYPGKDKLRQAKHGEYEATCLRCGSIARDNYNWHR